MDVRVGALFCLLLGSTWLCGARHLTDPGLQGLENIGRNTDVCTTCEEYATMAVEYLSQNKTHKEVMDALHKACSEMYTLKQKCNTRVDYYAPLFFNEVSQVHPEAFCKKVGLCQNTRISLLPSNEDKCDFCHRTVDELLLKLKDPDTKLEIIEMMLKACEAMETYATKCKSMVLEYGPMILINAENFLKKTDICATLHACSPAEELEVQPQQMISMVTSS